MRRGTFILSAFTAVAASAAALLYLIPPASFNPFIAKIAFGCGAAFCVFGSGYVYFRAYRRFKQAEWPREFARQRGTTSAKLARAGWHPNRNVWEQLELPKSLPVFPAAKRFLTEFGGLKFGSPTDIVEFNPAIGEEAVEEIKLAERALGSGLYPIGRMEHQDRFYLLMDEQGIVYTLIDYLEGKPAKLYVELEPLASSPDLAVELLVNRYAGGARRAMEENLRSAGLLGKLWNLEKGKDCSA